MRTWNRGWAACGVIRCQRLPHRPPPHLQEPGEHLPLRLGLLLLGQRLALQQQEPILCRHGGCRPRATLVRHDSWDRAHGCEKWGGILRVPTAAPRPPRPCSPLPTPISSSWGPPQGPPPHFGVPPGPIAPTPRFPVPHHGGDAPPHPGIGPVPPPQYPRPSGRRPTGLLATTTSGWGGSRVPLPSVGRQTPPGLEERPRNRKGGPRRVPASPPLAGV